PLRPGLRAAAAARSRTRCRRDGRRPRGSWSRSRRDGLADLLIKILVLRNDTAGVEALLGGGARGAGEARMQLGVFQQGDGAVRLGGNIADRLEKAVLAVGDQFGQS